MTLKQKGPVAYLIHFRKPYRHAKHYLGFSTNLDKRITDHLAGMETRLMEVITQAGIDWRVVRTWPGGREIERKLKNRKEAPRLCPICNPDAMNRAIFTAKGDRDQ